ncbi:unnamed protein product, partial [Ectocarpus sp. 8 AP-2014]
IRCCPARSAALVLAFALVKIKKCATSAAVCIHPSPQKSSAKRLCFHPEHDEAELTGCAYPKNRGKTGHEHHPSRAHLAWWNVPWYVVPCRQALLPLTLGAGGGEY